MKSLFLKSSIERESEVGGFEKRGLEKTLIFFRKNLVISEKVLNFEDLPLTRKRVRQGERLKTEKIEIRLLENIFELFQKRFGNKK